MQLQDDKARAFRKLHERDGAFIIPNPWDVGSARIVAALGFEALATTSAGFAFSRGKLDNTVGREEMLGHIRELVEATPLPVSADLENGFGHDPQTVAETISMSIDCGLAGGSVEDSTQDSSAPIYPRELATARIRAAVEAIRAAPTDFVLTARCENYLVGKPDLGDTIARLQAYQDAGADVLYAPGLTSRDDIAAVVSSVDRPVNVVMGLQGAKLNLADLAEIGVKRVSVGSALARAALGALIRAVNEMRERGSFEFAGDSVAYADISVLLSR